MSTGDVIAFEKSLVQCFLQALDDGGISLKLRPRVFECRAGDAVLDGIPELAQVGEHRGQRIDCGRREVLEAGAQASELRADDKLQALDCLLEPLACLFRSGGDSLGVVLVFVEERLGKTDEVLERNLAPLQRLVQLAGGQARGLGELGEGTRQAFTDLAPEFFGLDLALTEDLSGGKQDAGQSLAVTAQRLVGS